MPAKHVKSAPYLFSSFLPSFIRNGPNISTPQLVNGVPSNVLSFDRSTIFCSPKFPQTIRHLKHFSIRFLKIVLYLTTQKPLLLISLIVSPLSSFHHQFRACSRRERTFLLSGTCFDQLLVDLSPYSLNQGRWLMDQIYLT